MLCSKPFLKGSTHLTYSAVTIGDMILSFFIFLGHPSVHAKTSQTAIVWSDGYIYWQYVQTQQQNNENLWQYYKKVFRK